MRKKIWRFAVKCLDLPLKGLRLLGQQLNLKAMLRTGKTLFICDECSKVFVVTTFGGGIINTPLEAPMPQKCPKCGSFHTLPMTGLLFKGKYKKIWEEIDATTQNNN